MALPCSLCAIFTACFSKATLTNYMIYYNFNCHVTKGKNYCYKVLKLGTEGVTEHLLQGQEKCKLQFMFQSKLNKNGSIEN